MTETDSMKQLESNSDEVEHGSSAEILRRNNKGCKSVDFYNWPEQPLEQMDTPLAVQQYIQQLIYKNPADIDRILQLPEGQDPGAWKIEHLRIFCMQLNRLAAKLQECCLPETCNQMTATEQWIFLCAAHKQPNECPAIDYTRHTLDGAANLLNSNKYFPSRVTIKESSVAKLGSLCRRVYRIFSHAYYHHYAVFGEFERDTHLCKRFSKFVTNYDLMPKDSLIVPADGTKPELNEEPQQQDADKSITTNAPNTTDSSIGSSPQQQARQSNEETMVKKELIDSPESNDATSGDVTSTSVRVEHSSGRKDIKNEELTPASNTTTWTPSIASNTSTMVKGTRIDPSPETVRQGTNQS